MSRLRLCFALAAAVRVGTAALLQIYSRRKRKFARFSGDIVAWIVSGKSVLGRIESEPHLEILSRAKVDMELVHAAIFSRNPAIYCRRPAEESRARRGMRPRRIDGLYRRFGILRRGF